MQPSEISNEPEPRRDDLQGWKMGPLPAGTHQYGAVVLYGPDGKPEKGFHWADFRGDRVLIPDVGHYGVKEIKPKEVAFFTNPIVFPFIPSK